MQRTHATFRVFVSSTFSDLKGERNALQRNVFPRLRELCHRHGCRFQAIDLRWGIREEAAFDQQTMRICLEEIVRCQRVTPRPNFIVLLGDRYGWRPLPFAIPADEFAEIERRLPASDERDLLTRWYRCDENAVPPVYDLQPREGEFTNLERWSEVECKLRAILLAATEGMAADGRLKYCASATEQEIVRGALGVADAREHVFGFFRAIRNVPPEKRAKDFVDLDAADQLDVEARQRVKQLKRFLRDKLGENIHDYEAAWRGAEPTYEHIGSLPDNLDECLKLVEQADAPHPVLATFVDIEVLFSDLGTARRKSGRGRGVRCDAGSRTGRGGGTSDRNGTRGERGTVWHTHDSLAGRTDGAGVKETNVAQPGTREWHEEQLTKFNSARGNLQSAEAILTEVLKQIAKRTAPMAIVQARAKSLASFSEKALRKQHKYANPAEQLTDLVGGRIITYTRSECVAVCRFIESLDREKPWIDWDNSEDTSKRLKPEEFGYQAMHYVVQLRPPEMLGQECGAWIARYKMEVQVCTMMHHVWSTVGHDRVYKTALHVPDQLKRRLSAASAMIEAAQTEFDSAVAGLDRYIEAYPPYITQDTQSQEELKWASVVAVEPHDQDAQRKLAKFYLQTEKWRLANRVLNGCDDTLPGVLERKGLAALHLGNLAKAERLLDKAVARDEGNWSAWCDLAQVRMRRKSRYDAIDEYAAAFKIAPSEPRALVGYVSALVSKERSARCTKALHGALRSAIDECWRRVELGVDLPTAYFQIARCHIFGGRCYDALDAYCRAGGTCLSVQQIGAELRDVQRIENRLSKRDGNVFTTVSCARRLLQLLAIALPRSDSRALNPTTGQKMILRKLATGQNRPTYSNRPVVIVAGGCDARVRTLIRGYEGIIRKAFGHFEGTFICGGTTAGISGVMARIKQDRGKAVEAIGYLPLPLPKLGKISKAYRICKVRAEGYSPIGVIQMWVDLLLAGVDPAGVRVLGINGGDLSGFEYRLAMAMGATVGLMEASGRAVNSLLAERNLHHLGRGVALFEDPATIAAFVSVHCPSWQAVPDSEQRRQKREELALTLHERFRNDHIESPGYVHPSMLRWEGKLPEPYRISSREQAGSMDRLLQTEGFAIVPDNDPRPAFVFNVKRKRDIVILDRLAEREHGRWNAERLAEGWVYGKERSLEKKTSPYLVPWKKLPEDVKKWDRDPFLKWPEVLGNLGLKVVKLKR